MIFGVALGVALTTTQHVILRSRPTSFKDLKVVVTHVYLIMCCTSFVPF